MSPTEARDLGLHRIGSVGSHMLDGVIAAAHVVERARSAPEHDVRLTGTLRLLAPGRRSSGLDWIDSGVAGAERRVEARLSRALATPTIAPDVFTLRVRVFDGDRAGDLGLASSSRGPGRLTLAPCTSLSDTWFSSVMPYRGSEGPVLIGAYSRSPRPLTTDLEAVPDLLRKSPWRLELHWASGLGTWHRFAVLRLTAATVPAHEVAEGTGAQFDSALHALSPNDTYGWIAG